MVPLTGDVGTLCFQSPGECWLALQEDIFTVCELCRTGQEREAEAVRRGQRVAEGKDPS